VDGDAVLLAAARAMKAAGHLPGDTVVSTVMSNLGLERALERDGIRMTRTPVGGQVRAGRNGAAGRGPGAESNRAT